MQQNIDYYRKNIKQFVENRIKKFDEIIDEDKAFLKSMNL